MTALSTPSSDSVVWEAALGRRVVLIEAKTWFAARDKARALLGGEPSFVSAQCPGFDSRQLFVWDWVAHRKRRAYYLREYFYHTGEE